MSKIEELASKIDVQKIKEEAHGEKMSAQELADKVNRLSLYLPGTEGRHYTNQITIGELKKNKTNEVESSLEKLVEQNSNIKTDLAEV